MPDESIAPNTSQLETLLARFCRSGGISIGAEDSSDYSYFKGDIFTEIATLENAGVPELCKILESKAFAIRRGGGKALDRLSRTGFNFSDDDRADCYQDLVADRRAIGIAAALEYSSRSFDVVPPLCSLMANGRNVGICAYVFGRIADQRAVNPLLSALSSVDPVVREVVALSLRKIGDRTSIVQLLQMSRSDSDIRARVASCVALAKLNAKDSLEEILRCFVDVFEESPDRHFGINLFIGDALLEATETRWERETFAVVSPYTKALRTASQLAIERLQILDTGFVQRVSDCLRRF